jgi:hypothetical protein
VRAINAQFRLTDFQARAAAQAATLQAREAGDRAARLGEFFLSDTNTAGGSVQGQQYRTRRTSTGGSVSELVSFAGGGYTGHGPRSGGLDGQGGFMAVLHPQEQVIDLHRSGPRTAAGGAAGGSRGGSFTAEFKLNHTGPVYRLPNGADAITMADAEAITARALEDYEAYRVSIDGRRAIGMA